MKTLEQIKNDYAVTQGCKDFSELLMTTYKQSDLGDIYDDLLFLVQKECLKLASRNSKVVVEGILTEEKKTSFTLFDKGVKGVVKRKVSVCKESITNEKNIIK